MAWYEVQDERARASHHAKITRDRQRPYVVADADDDTATARARVCVTCQRPYTLAAGELRFELATGIRYQHCPRRCRPTRRAALAAGATP